MKKTYIVPSMELVEISGECALLSGSGESLTIDNSTILDNDLNVASKKNSFDLWTEEEE